MKKTLLIILAIVVVVFIGGLIWTLGFGDKEVVTPSEPITFPSSGSPSVTTPNETLQARNFLTDPDVAEDPVNPGYYYLGYQTFGEAAVEEPPYLITYIKETGHFNITVLTEPIGDTRRSVEAYLAPKLNATPAEMCALDYMISVPTTVNSAYASMNLGFSFCPNAVVLP